eukprot:5640712-Lingulodinium_polyedra.AAC.1
MVFDAPFIVRSFVEQSHVLSERVQTRAGVCSMFGPRSLAVPPQTLFEFIRQPFLAGVLCR